LSFLQQGIVKYSIIFEKKSTFSIMNLHHSVTIAFYLSSSSCLLLIYKKICFSTMLYALMDSTFLVSATSVPISQRTTNKLHFFSGNCSDPDVQRQIKEQFIQLLNGSMFKEVCQADTLRDRCKADNVKVTCYSDTRRRRSLSGGFKGYLLLKF